MGRKRKAGALPSPLVPSLSEPRSASVKQHHAKHSASRVDVRKPSSTSTVAAVDESRPRRRSSSRISNNNSNNNNDDDDHNKDSKAHLRDQDGSNGSAAAAIGWKKKRRKRNKKSLETAVFVASNSCANASRLFSNSRRFTPPLLSSAPTPAPDIPQKDVFLFKLKHNKNSPEPPQKAAAITAAKASPPPAGRVANSDADTRLHERERWTQRGGEEAASANVKVGMMTPSDTLKHLIPVGGWRLGSCWEEDCACTGFNTQPAIRVVDTMLSTATSGGTGAATPPVIKPVAAGPMICGCGHRSVAHELVDVKEKDSKDFAPLWCPASGHDAGAREARVLAASLRRLFAAIRNARAVGDCGLFEDSDGVCCWGAGWFLSRLARGYLHEAGQAMAELGNMLHHPPVVRRCLIAAERLMSGKISGDTPGSLPLSTIYQALGTSIASELDLAYWHARYTAASRFNAGGVRADAPFQVVPPPEVYFVCLVSHLPSPADLCAYPGLKNAALRKMLEEVFDLHVDGQHSSDEASRAGGASANELEFPVLTNPLLAVTQTAWLETAVAADARSWVPHYPPRFGEPEGTMRGSAPALPVPIRARCDAVRDWSARLLSFAVPNQRAIEACRRAVEAAGGSRAGIVEVGAGLGYWKWVLEGWSEQSGLKGGGNARSSTADGIPTTAENSLEVLAIDKDPSQLPSPGRLNQSGTQGRHGMLDRRVRNQGRGEKGHGHAGRQGKRGRGGDVTPAAVACSNDYHGGAPAWATVEKGGPECVRSLSAVSYPVLFLCYPPPSIGSGGGGGTAACMGADTLAIFSGNVLLYVGEVGGDTGSPRLEAMLRGAWDMVDEVELPCFPSTANRLMVFTRKGSSLPKYTPGHPLSMYRCSRCAASGCVRRCRLTRAVSYCSEECFALDVDRWQANLEGRHVYLGAASGLAGAVTGHGLPEQTFRDQQLFKRIVLHPPNSSK